MAPTTRSGTIVPPPEVLLVNPTLPQSWPSTPTTPAELDVWMAETKAALLKWLSEAAGQAQDANIEADIDEYNKAAGKKWKPFEQQTDVETGDIHDPTQRGVMKEAVEEEGKARAKLHKKHKTWQKFIEYRFAQAAWEDFLYYQNVWNRKQHVPGKIYYETYKENQRLRKLETLNKNLRGKGEDSGSDEVPIPKAPKRPKAIDPVPPVLGTAGRDRMNRLHADFQNGEPFIGRHQIWLNHVIDLYKNAHLGYRKRIPDVVAPQDAHRYTQPPRGTTPRKTPHYQKRHRHLEERFPRLKRHQIDVHETEEDYRTKPERKTDIRLGRTGEMQPIAWRIDEAAYERLRAQTETTRGFSQNPLTLSLLPKGHKTHHGSLETSFNWPTSFDSAEWGQNRSATAMQRDYVYEWLSDPEHDPDDPKSRKRFLGYKKDENGQRIKKIETKPPHKRGIHMERGRVFQHEQILHPRLGFNVVSRHRNDDWRGKWVEGQIPKLDWILDEDGNRIPLPPPYESRNKFNTYLVEESHVRETRLQRHRVARETYELSDEEDEQFVMSNVNFPRSGNMNPDRLGNPWASDVGSDGEKGLDRSDDSSDDDESDDDGDLFASSYRECSGTGKCARTKQARLFLKSLQERFGVLASWTVQHIIDFQRDDPGFETVSDKGITEMYATEAGYM